MWFSDANIQIIGYHIDGWDDMSVHEQLGYWDIFQNITKFNDSMRYSNIIKRQNKEIKELEVELLKEKLKNAENELKEVADV